MAQALSPSLWDPLVVGKEVQHWKVEMDVDLRKYTKYGRALFEDTLIGWSQVEPKG